MENMLLTSLGDLKARSDKGVASTADPGMEQKLLDLVVVFEKLLRKANSSKIGDWDYWDKGQKVSLD